MSFKPQDFIKDTFRNSVKFLWITIITVAGNEILLANYEKAIHLFGLSLYMVIVLGFTYIPAIREQIVAYQSFKMYSPRVEQLDGTIVSLEHEKQAEKTLKEIDKATAGFKLNSREESLQETIKRLEQQIEELK